MMRTEEAVSASIWLAKVGRLTRTAKMNRETAIERIVRIVLRLLRVRFLKTNNANFVILSPVRQAAVSVEWAGLAVLAPCFLTVNMSLSEWATVYTDRSE